MCRCSRIQSSSWTRSSAPDRGGASALYPPPDVPPVVRSAVDALVLLTGRQILLGTSRDPKSPAAQRVPTKRAATMKQTLGDLMRMSRICRMVFATCLGSFIVVIFYFQSMFQPGKIPLPSVSSIAMRRSYLRVDASIESVTQLMVDPDGNQPPSRQDPPARLVALLTRFSRVVCACWQRWRGRFCLRETWFADGHRGK